MNSPTDHSSSAGGASSPSGSPAVAAPVAGPFLTRLCAHRFGGLVIFVLSFVVISLAIRLVLLATVAGELDWSPIAVGKMFLAGFIQDLAAAAYAGVPIVLWLALTPERWFHSRSGEWVVRAGAFMAVAIVLFSTVAEWFFWSEFRTRFNFIAVDYLIYTREVWGNIRESYPMPAIFAGLALAAASSVWLITRSTVWRVWRESRSTATARGAVVAGCLLFSLACFFAMDGAQLWSQANMYNAELSKNGIYVLFSEFRHNEIDYQKFYPTRPTEEVFATLRREVGLPPNGGIPDVTRRVNAPMPGGERRLNVMQITVESLSASFLGSFGNDGHLTPNLDRFAGESLFFTRFHATGTRTDRGMEALSLGLPPTPGRSIVKRSGNENLFVLGSVFRAHGYATKFLYGGFGYFDNMNHFFSENGYSIVDRNNFAAEEKTFGNVWGLCDEDLFNRALTEADKNHAAGQPFFYFVMTTSNHRPYTYPSGRIDIPSKSGRDGAVKYTDYAIGKLIEDARQRPWFKDTIFVIVADHCARSGGKTELPIKGYEIPLLIYSPGNIAPARVDKLCSQIDYPPTLLGLLNWGYESKFLGKDILRMQPEEERAFIGSYQKLGMITRDDLIVLRPKSPPVQFRYQRSDGALTGTALDPDLANQAIAYYQGAAYLFRSGLYGTLEKK